VIAKDARRLKSNARLIFTGTPTPISGTVVNRVGRDRFNFKWDDDDSQTLLHVDDMQNFSHETSSN
jgi:hypothetical protein